MAVVLENSEWQVPVLLVNVYFPPGYTRGEFHNFLHEFKRLLDVITREYNHIIFTGDFNIHMDNGMQSSAIEFYMMLNVRGLVQHVNEPTHIGGHTLDLVFTWNMDISDLTVRDMDISDHYMIIFRIVPVLRRKKRNKKNKRIAKEN